MKLEVHKTLSLVVMLSLGRGYHMCRLLLKQSSASLGIFAGTVNKKDMIIEMLGLSTSQVKPSTCLSTLSIPSGFSKLQSVRSLF